MVDLEAKLTQGNTQLVQFEAKMDTQQRQLQALKEQLARVQGQRSK
jgi:uncharacterized coiled-coil protein SlyX